MCYKSKEKLLKKDKSDMRRTCILAVGIFSSIATNAMMNCPMEYSQSQRYAFDQNVQQISHFVPKINEISEELVNATSADMVMLALQKLLEITISISNFHDSMLRIARSYGNGSIDIDVSGDLCSYSSCLLSDISKILKGIQSKICSFDPQAKQDAEALMAEFGKLELIP